MFSIGFVWLFFSYFSIKKGMHPFFRNTKESRFEFIIGWNCFYLGILNLLKDYEWIPIATMREFSIPFIPHSYFIIIFAPIFIGMATITYFFKKYIPNIKETPCPEPKFKDYMTWDIWLIITIGIFIFFYPLLEVWFWVYFMAWF